MRHLDGSELADADGIAVIPLLLVVFVLQLNDTPDSAAEQTVILLGIAVVDGDILQSEIGKIRIEGIAPNIQAGGDHIDHRMASIAAQPCKDFLCFIRTNKIVS